MSPSAAPTIKIPYEGVAIIGDVTLFANTTRVLLATENTESTEISYMLG